VARGLGDNVDTNFGRVAPNKNWEGKKRQKFEAISDHIRLWSQISPERIDIAKIGKMRCQLQAIPFGETNLVSSGSNLTKLYQATCQEAAVITWVQRVGGVPQQNLEGQKNVKNSARFRTTFDFDRKYLWNGST